MNKSKLWSKEDLDLITKMYLNGSPISSIAVAVKRTIASTRTQISLLKVYRPADKSLHPYCLKKRRSINIIVMEVYGEDYFDDFLGNY